MTLKYCADNYKLNDPYFCTYMDLFQIIKPCKKPAWTRTLCHKKLLPYSYIVFLPLVIKYILVPCTIVAIYFRHLRTWPWWKALQSALY